MITYIDTSSLLKLIIDATVLTSADAALCEAAARYRLHVANPLVA